MESLPTPKDYHQLEILQNLLDTVPASTLRNSLEDLFFTCMAQETTVLPSHEMAQHIYYLLLFLREVE